MDTYSVAQCAQSLSRYAKQAMCRLLLPPNLFAILLEALSMGFLHAIQTMITMGVVLR